MLSAAAPGSPMLWFARLSNPTFIPDTTIPVASTVASSSSRGREHRAPLTLIAMGSPASPISGKSSISSGRPCSAQNWANFSTWCAIATTTTTTTTTTTGAEQLSF